MDRSRFEKESRDYVQIALKKGKTVKYAQETVAGRNTNDSEEHATVDESDSYASSTLNEEKRTAMSRFIKEIAYCACSTTRMSETRCRSTS